MDYVRKTQRKTAPLLVREIIFPDKTKPETSQSYLKKTSGTATDFKNVVPELGENNGYSPVIIEGHNVRPIGELINLEKKPLENYFAGTKGKKHKKKKKHEKFSQRFQDCHFKESETESYEGRASSSKDEETLTVEEKIQNKKLLIKIRRFEKMKECMQQKNYRNQRLIEDKFIEQQENLAETWWKFIKRRNKLKQFNSNDTWPCHEPPFEKRHTTDSEVQISIEPQKFWNERKENIDSFGKKGNTIELNSSYQTIDELRKEFIENLVFVDDEESDQFDCRRGSVSAKGGI